MFDTAAAIRLLAYAGHLRAGKTESSSVTVIQYAQANRKAEGRTKRVRNVAWYSPEWWEHHNYEHR